MDERRARFERIWHDCASAVAAYALRRTSPEAVEDAVAETFLVAWRRLDEVPAEPLPWLYGVARRTLANHCFVSVSSRFRIIVQTAVKAACSIAFSFSLRGESPTFQSDLQARLVREVLAELRSGRIENFGFERLIQTVLRGLGASEVRIVPRSEDKGADLVAVFRVAGAFQQRVAVQAKHWQPEPPVGRDVVEQKLRVRHLRLLRRAVRVTTFTCMRMLNP